MVEHSTITKEKMPSMGPPSRTDSSDKTLKQKDNPQVSKSETKSQPPQASPSPQSHSRRKKANLPRKRPLKRKAWFHVLYSDVEDAKWLHAAYTMRSFDDFIPEGYSQLEFDEVIKQVLVAFAGNSGCVYMLEAHHGAKKTTIPVGVLVVRLFEGALWPHAHWFSWATPRNKIEAVVAILQELKKEAPLMIIAEKDMVRFLSHMARYGLLSKSKKLHKFNGKIRYLYYGKKKE